MWSGRATLRVCSVVVLPALVHAMLVLAQTPAAGSWREEIRRLREVPAVQPGLGVGKEGLRAMRTIGKGGLVRWLDAGRPLTARAAAAVTETEPNDTVATADSAALGDRATGVVNPAGDADTWFLDLNAGQFLSVDVDASQAGSALDPTLALLAPDGRTLLAFNDDFDGLDSRISFRVPASGRYAVMIRAFGGAGGPALRYDINFGTVTCAAVGTEREPNDTPATAAPVAIGDSGSGEICPRDANPAGDVDYWAFTGQAGTTIELDLDAASLGVLSDPFLAIFASDGTTRLTFNDDTDGRDSRIQFSINTTGTYYAAVSTLANAGGNPFPYTLHVRSSAQGPGDPITVRAQGLGRPVGLAVGNTGDLFAADVTGNRVVRVSGQGVVTTFATGIQSPQSLAFDAFGFLLVASADGIVYRITPQGQVTRFLTDAGIPFWIAVGSDGRIWLTDLSDQSLRRYSPTGRFEARFDASVVGGFGPGPLAIGPSGEPYFSSGTEIWKLVNGQPRRVLSDGVVLWAFAFDLAGNIYAPAPAAGRIKLFDPNGTILADLFAVGPDAPQAVAFGRDGTGATVARLFATELRVAQLIEVNPAGVGRPGHPVGFTASFSVDVAVASLLGAGGLSAADMAFLDAMGNRNGRYDVGDLQAYLRLTGNLPGTAAVAAPRQLERDR